MTKSASIHPSTPLEAQELVTDQALRDLAKGGPERGSGAISSEDQALLSMSLPEICGELLAYRLAHRRNGTVFPQPATLTERLRAATRRIWRLVAT